jgi:hypothetical protein
MNIKKTITAVIFIAALYMIYLIFYTPKSELKKEIQKDENLSTKEIYKESQKVISKKSNTLVKKDKTNEGKKEQNIEIVTNSKVLRDLANSIIKRDFDTFDKVYEKQIKLLREDGDHSQFYEDFKLFLFENKLPIAENGAIINLLIYTGTKESWQTYFDLISEEIIKDDELLYRQSKQMDTSRDFLLQDPKVNAKEITEVLKKEYKHIKNNNIKKSTAKLIAGFDGSAHTLSYLFSAYLNAKNGNDRYIAMEGLKSLNSDEILPPLNDYLRSKDEEVHKTAGVVLSNLGSSKSVEVFADWISDGATVENSDEIKKWLSTEIDYLGVNTIVKSIDLEKIQDEDLREEMKSFLDEQIDKNREERE